jgi:hypothetical protein
MARHWTKPREHGAWGMLYVPFALALLAGGRVSWDAAVLVAAATFAFLSRAPLQAAVRAWHWRRDFREPLALGALYLAGAGACGVLLMASGHTGLLVPAAAGAAILGLNLFQSAGREEKTLPAEILAAAGLALTAPAAHYVVLGRWTAEAWILWVLCAAFFTSGILYIKLRIAGMAQKIPGEHPRLRRWCGAYHAALPVALAAGAAAGIWPWAALVAFSPVIARGLGEGMIEPGKVELRRAGWLEVAWSLVFLLVLGFAFRITGS